jgi:putative peptide zinc metalloprotease protein
LTAQEAPTRADGLQLIGEMKGSGYRTPPALVRRADGQTVQLTALLYAVLEEIRDRRTVEEVAARVSARLDRTVTAANVSSLIDGQLRPLGLLTRPDGSQPELRRSNPLLGLRWKFAITSTRITRRITAPFVRLFNPFLVTIVTVGFIAVAWWVLFDKGLASATYEAFQHPALLVLILAVMLVSAAFHEFGHAAATHRGGAQPGVMGAGLYLVWPAFYTDVTDSYRLGRLGRLRTDLGGLYFDALVTVGVFAVWWATRWDGWLLVVASQAVGMSRQLAPMVRFDGYHILCDLTGVPDLFQRIKPVLLSFLPRYWRSPQVAALKPWVRVVVSLWVLVVIPVLLIALLAILFSFPRVAGTAWARIGEHAAYLSDAAGQGAVGEVAGRAVAILATGLPVLAMALMLARVAYGAGRRAWVRTRGKPVKRTIAGVVALLLAALVALLWWPDADRYRPVQPWEHGTLTDVAPAAALGSPQALQEGSLGRTTMTLAAGEPAPTRDHPQLALVLVPTGQPADAAATSTTGGGDSSTQQTWVFPFNRPLAPEEGDNQAMAVNYTDGGATYDVAVAMVWVEDGAEVHNRNEAYALASCTDCTTVAVAFQVLVVVGQSDVVIPRNVAAAVNYNCRSCVTVALAQQLLVTVDRLPSEATMAQISALWDELMRWSQGIDRLTFDEIAERLDDFEVQVLTLLQDDGVLSLPAGTETSTSTPSPTTSESPTTSGATPTAGSGPSPLRSTPSDVATPQSPAPTAAATDAGTQAPEPSPTSSPSSTSSPTGSSSGSSPSASPTTAG